MDLLSIMELLFERKTIKRFRLKLKRSGYSKGLNGWLTAALIQGLFLSLISFVSLIFFGLDDLFLYGLAAALFLAPLILHYSWACLKEENKKRRIEEDVPDVLLQASLFSQGTPMLKVIEHLALADYGLLSLEFKLALKELEKGASVEECLYSLKQRVDSKIVNRAINLLIQGYQSGADTGQVLKDAAEDLMATKALLQERNATLVIEKMTLLAASGLIVPLILGMIVNLVLGLQGGLLAGSAMDGSALQRQALIEASLLSIQIYLLEYAVLASVFVAFLENRINKAFLYALVLLPVSYGIYHLVQLVL